MCLVVVACCTCRRSLSWVVCSCSLLCVVLVVVRCVLCVVGCCMFLLVVLVLLVSFLGRLVCVDCV